MLNPPKPMRRPGAGLLGNKWVPVGIVTMDERRLIDTGYRHSSL